MHKNLDARTCVAIEFHFTSNNFSYDDDDNDSENDDDDGDEEDKQWQTNWPSKLFFIFIVIRGA